MTKLPQLISAFGQSGFEGILKQTISELGNELPLQAGLAAGSYALEKPLDVMVISTTETPDCIETKIGIFYKSLMPGCACAGDPTVEDEQNEHITVLVSIGKKLPKPPSSYWKIEFAVFIHHLNRSCEDPNYHSPADGDPGC